MMTARAVNEDHRRARKIIGLMGKIIQTGGNGHMSCLPGGDPALRYQEIIIYFGIGGWGLKDRTLAANLTMCELLRRFLILERTRVL